VYAQRRPAGGVPFCGNLAINARGPFQRRIRVLVRPVAVTAESLSPIVVVVEFS